MLTIMDLSDLVLQKILRYIPDRSKDNLSQVSQRFRNLIDKSYGKVLILGEPSASMKKSLPRYKWISHDGLNAIRFNGVRYCRVGKLLDAKASSGMCRFFYMMRDFVSNSNQPLSFKYPNLLRKLQFEGRISPHYFEALTTRIYNLRSLSLHWKALSSLNSGVLDPLQFPNLITLDIWGGHDIKENAKVHFEKLCNFVESFAILLKNVFIQLRVFRMDLPNQPRLLMLLTSLVIAFLHRHSKTLLIFKFELIPMSVWEGEPNNSLEWIQCSPVLYQKIQDLSLRLRLKSLELTTCGNADNEISYLNIWTILAMGLGSLKEFQGTGFPIRQDVAKQITFNNMKSLNRIHLCIQLMDLGIWKPIDCSIFSNCPLLTQLLLEGSEYCKRRMSDPGIINVNSLPGSLKTLSICRIPVSITSLESIFFRMYCLTHLRLIGIGNTAEFGMPLGLLNAILNTKKLQAFAISCDSIRYHEEEKSSVPFIFLKVCPEADEYPDEYLRTHKDDIIEVRLTEKYSYEVVNSL